MDELKEDKEYKYLVEIYGEKEVITQLNKWIDEFKDVDLKDYCKKKLINWYNEIKKLRNE
jgi:hypothetical protein